MKASEAAKLLANRVNQLHYVESIMEKVYKCGLRDAATPPTPFTPERSPKEEAERLVDSYKEHDYEYAIMLVTNTVNYTITALKAANVSTEWHEQVLNELRGM